MDATTLGTLNTTNGSRTWSYTFAPGGPQGLLNLTAVAVDAAGLVDATPATRAFTLNAPAAVAPETVLVRSGRRRHRERRRRWP